MAVLCNKTGVYAIKNPGLEFCAITSSIQQLSSKGRGVLISGDWRRFLVTNLFMSTLLMQTLLYTALRSVTVVQRQKGLI